MANVKGNTGSGVKRGSTQAKRDAEKVTVASTVEVLVAQGGNIWQAKLAAGEAIEEARVQGLSLVDIANAIKKLGKDDRDKVAQVVVIGDVDNNNKSNLSKLAKLYRVFSKGVTSPDGKRSVSAEKIASWELSTGDATKLATLIESGKVKIATLEGYGADDNGKEQVKKLLVSKKDSTSTSKGKTILGVNESTFTRLESLLAAERLASANKDLKMTDILEVLLATYDGVAKKEKASKK